MCVVTHVRLGAPARRVCDRVAAGGCEVRPVGSPSIDSPRCARRRGAMRGRVVTAFHELESRSFRPIGAETVEIIDKNCISAGSGEVSAPFASRQLAGVRGRLLLTVPQCVVPVCVT